MNPHFLNGRQNMAALEEKLSRKDDRHKDDDGEVKDKDDNIQRKVMLHLIPGIISKCQVLNITILKFLL